MSARTGMGEQEALICTMVLVAAAEDGGITDREIGAMSAQLQTLPVFNNFSSEQLDSATQATIGLLREEDGLAHAGQLIRDALEPRLRETAYALACEVVASQRLHSETIFEMLELVGSELRLDPLVTTAIERGTRARYQTVDRSEAVAVMTGKRARG